MSRARLQKLTAAQEMGATGTAASIIDAEYVRATGRDPEAGRDCHGPEDDAEALPDATGIEDEAEAVLDATGNEDEADLRPRDRSPGTKDDIESVCDCPGAEEDAAIRPRGWEEYFACSLCKRLQHYECEIKHPGERIGLEHYRCNICATAKSKVEQNINDMAKRVRQKEEEVKQLIMEMMWRHYCHLPAGEANPAVMNATKMKVSADGPMVPKQAAPKSWVQAVQKNVDDLMKASSMELTDFAIRPEYQMLKLNERILMQMREIAHNLIHGGVYKGNRGKLGVLAEVLGFEKKGTVFKG